MDGKATWQTAFSASIFNDVISVSVCGYSSSKVCATMRGAEKREGRSRKRRRRIPPFHSNRGAAAAAKGAAKNSVKVHVRRNFIPLLNTCRDGKERLTQCSATFQIQTWGSPVNFSLSLIILL